VHSLIPEVIYQPDQMRESRAVCSICDQLHQFLYGVALQEDVAALQETVESSQNLTQKRLESIEKSLSAVKLFASN
jgi:hypothetical protein